MECNWITHRLCIWILIVFIPLVYSVSVTITKEDNSPGNIEERNGDKEFRVTNGDDIGINCVVLGDRDFTWALWTQNGLALTFNDELLASHKARYRLEQETTNNGMIFTLYIRNVQLKDEGDFACQVPDGLIDNVQLYVTTRPNITTITGLQRAQVGDRVELQCKASGSPEPAIRWRHKRPNHMLPNGMEGSYYQSDTLVIESITLDDRGEYECLASNGVKDGGKASFVGTSFIRMDYRPTVEPVFGDFPVVQAAAGNHGYLMCKSMAYPRSSGSDVVWYFDDADGSDKQLSNGQNGYSWEVVHQIPKEDVDRYEETTFSTLEIDEVNNRTIGQYRCQFRNSKGIADAAIRVQFAPVEGGDVLASQSKASHLAVSSCTLPWLLLMLLTVIRVLR